jgi:hypothetical protein
LNIEPSEQALFDLGQLVDGFKSHRSRANHRGVELR